MNPDKQHTLKGSATVKGVGLHTGEPVTLTLRPAPIGHGGNPWAGGTNTSAFLADYRLPNCTLSIDGKAVAENGALKH